MCDNLALPRCGTVVRCPFAIALSLPALLKLHGWGREILVPVSEALMSLNGRSTIPIELESTAVNAMCFSLAAYVKELPSVL